MSDSLDYDERFGLDIPLDEAVGRFVNASVMREGETARLEFKGALIRKVLHNAEWWFSVVDIIGALAGTERASKYWSQLKSKLSEKEGFSELSAKIGKLLLPSAPRRAVQGVAVGSVGAAESCATVMHDRAQDPHDQALGDGRSGLEALEQSGRASRR